MTVQNYIGLDARIEAIVRALMGDIDVDLSDFYTKEEVNALIASGGTGLQINYNDLLNRPIIDGLLQSNLDLNGHFLLYNSQRLYCPAVIENIITFDSDVSIPNVYTKAEADERFGGGGSIPDPLNVNNLTVSKQLNIQSKDTTDESVKGYIQVAGRNTSEYYLSMGLQYGIIDVYPDRVDYRVNNVRFGAYDRVELNYNKETQRNLLSAEHTLDIQAPSISFNGTLENVYTKTECDEKFGGGGGTIPEDLSVNTLTLNNTTGVSLRGAKFSSTDDYAVIVTCVSDGTSKELFSMRQDGRIHMSDFWSLVMGRFSYNIIDDNPVMHIFRFNGDSTGKPSTFLIQADTISFEGKLENVYTKEEVDALIAGGGGGGTCNYHGPENDSVHSDAVQTWQLNFEGSDNPAYLNALVFAQLDMQTSTMCMVMNHFSKYIGFTYGSPIAETAGVCIYPEKNELYVSGKIQASNIEAQTGLLVTGPSVFNMRADITDLNINGSNCNVYTKDEVDAKLTGSFGSKLSVNTYKQDSTVSGEYNGLLSVGGNQNRLTVTAGRTSGFAAVGGALNNCTFSDRTENAGMMFIGGVNCNSGLTGVKQGLLVVGGQGNNPVLQSDGDAMVMVGPSNGFQMFYRASGNTAVFMMNGKTVNVQYSQTITHEAPFTGDVSEYSIGDPVFASGRVCQWDGVKSEWTYETNAMDCICEVKPEGTVGEYVGICVAFVDDENHYAAEPSANTKSLIFATHGDYYFNVADSSKYKIGDIILLDGSVLKDDMALTGKVMKMIIGRVTAKINKTTVAVLKD